MALKRILVGIIRIAAILAILLIGGSWVFEVILSYYEVRNAPAVVRVIPSELQDKSVSDAYDGKQSFIGYSFSIPWTDLDETQTKLYPVDSPTKTRVLLNFRSGLHLIANAVPPKSCEKELRDDLKLAIQAIRSIFGEDDYSCARAIDEFTPDAMHHWTFSQRVRSREKLLLVIKSLILFKPAEDGIFSIQNDHFKGFQQGNPKIPSNKLILSLFDDNGGIEIILTQNNGKNLEITQPELNRLIQSLSRTSNSAS